jgi:hypothetical protein
MGAGIVASEMLHNRRDWLLGGILKVQLKIQHHEGDHHSW